MRKLAIVLAAIAVWSFLITAAAAAPPSTFAASGELCLTHEPTVIAGFPSPTGVSVITTGEELTGTIASSPGWATLAGADVEIVISRERASFNFGTGTFSGQFSGVLTVTTGAGVLSGGIKGTVSGVFSNPNDILNSISASTAEVSWVINGLSTHAQGQGSASFAVVEEGENAGKFCGGLGLDGSFAER